MSNLLSNQPLKGMVDLFPQDMEKHLYFERQINKVLQQFSFHPYDTPVLEPIDIYLNKSSRELLEEQSYHFKDRGGRKLLLRPELTPSLARMVSKIIKKEIMPLKLYSLSKCYRYERPQKGRMREFRQLNVDILSSFGDNLMIRDLEIFLLIEKIFASFEVSLSQYRVLYNNRYWLNKVFEENNFTSQESQQAYSLLDRKNKVTKEQFKQELQQNFDSSKIALLQNLVTAKSPREIKVTEDEKIEQFYLMSDHLAKVSSNISFSACIVRGLDYYTGVVFEVFANDAEINRSLFGGGRYDHLLENYVKNANISGIGFGLGVDIFLLFLKNIKLLKSIKKKEKQVYLAPLQKIERAEDLQNLFHLVEKLFLKGYQTEIGEKGQIKNHFQKAEKKNCSLICFLGEKELAEKKVIIKNLITKEEINFYFCQ